MPNTYYKYKEREKNSQINWAEVGLDITKMLTDEAQAREQKKAEIDKATKESIALMSEAPTGESVTLSEAAIKYSDGVTNSLQNMERLLKSGVLKPRDYAIFRQNLTDGTEQAFTLYKDYQTSYAEKMKRFNENISSSAEVWMMENLEGYGDFSQVEFTHDPVTGKVVAIGPDGKPRSVNALKRQMRTNVDRFKVDETASSWVERNGSWTKITREIGSRTKAGSIFTTTDPSKKMLSEREIAELGLSAADGEQINLYFEAETAYVNSIINDPNAWKTSSILSDFIGGYDHTLDKEKAGGNVIYLKTNSQGGLMPELTDEQKKKAEAQLRLSIRNKIDKKEEAKTVNDWQRPSAAEESAGREAKKNTDVVSNIGKLYYGDDNEVDEAANFLRGLNPNITYIDRTEESLIVSYNDGSSEEIAFRDEDGNLKSQLGFIESATNFLMPTGSKITNVKEIARRGGLDQTQEFNTTSNVFNIGKGKEATENMNDVYVRVLKEKTNITPSMFVADDETKTKTNINSIVQSLPGLEGYTVDTSLAFNNEVVIKDTKGKTVMSFELDKVDGFTADKAADYVNNILQLSSNLLTLEQKGAWIQGKRDTANKGVRKEGRERITGATTTQNIPAENENENEGFLNK